MNKIHLRQAYYSQFFAPVFLLLLALYVFGDLLLGAGSQVLSARGNDTELYFYSCRSFAFEQMRQGNFCLWNPHVFSGTPFFGNFQPGLLYPVNWVHLFLPTDRAISVEIFLNVYLTGLGMYLWASHAQLKRIACLVAATTWMFGAPYFLKITAGHLAPLGAMCWIPWLLLAVDMLLAHKYRCGILLGIFAASMMLLAGHPQTAFTTTWAILFYVLIQLIRNKHRMRSFFCLMIICAGAGAVAAVQLGAGWAVASESTRTEGVGINFARVFSLPPENLVTLLMPDFFSSAIGPKYWGRAYIWEVSLFMGVAGFLLSLYGMFGNVRDTIRYWLPAFLLFFLATSAHTPLFEIFYNYLPGFNKFRSHSKFIIPTAAFIAMLAGVGADKLLQYESTQIKQRSIVAGSAIFGCLAAFLCGIWLSVVQPLGMGTLIRWVNSTNESYLSPVLATYNPYVQSATSQAAISFLICGGMLLIYALLLYAGRFRRNYLIVFALLAIIEMTVFARLHRPTFDLARHQAEAQKRFVKTEENYRFLGVNSENAALESRSYDMWGYDPMVLGRYIQFMTWSQGYSVQMVTMIVNPVDVKFTKYSPLYRMLRCRYISETNKKGEQRVGEAMAPLPHVLLLNRYQVKADRDSIFDAMKNPAFDPAQEVILEAQPAIKLAAGKVTGKAKVTESSPNYLSIEAETEGSAILLVTDSYSRDWKAWGLEGSSQQEYSVMPANYVLRAIPLQAGKHKIRLEYSPSAFHIGKWISIIAVITYALALSHYLLSRRRGLSSHRRDSVAVEEPG